MPIKCVYKKPPGKDVLEKVKMNEKTMNEKYGSGLRMVCDPLTTDEKYGAIRKLAQENNDYYAVLPYDEVDAAAGNMWVAVPGNHPRYGITAHIQRTDCGVRVNLFCFYEEDGEGIGSCEAEFPEPPEAKYLVTDYATRLGWSQDSQIDVLADFINANHLEGHLQTYLDNRSDEEEEINDN